LDFAETIKADQRLGAMADPAFVLDDFQPLPLSSAAVILSFPYYPFSLPFARSLLRSGCLRSPVSAVNGANPMKNEPERMKPWSKHATQRSCRGGGHDAP